MNTSSFWFQGKSVDPDDPGFPINQSLRFRGAQELRSAAPTPAPAGTEGTFSVWYKDADAGIPSNSGVLIYQFDQPNGGAGTYIGVGQNNPTYYNKSIVYNYSVSSSKAISNGSKSRSGCLVPPCSSIY